MLSREGTRPRALLITTLHWPWTTRLCFTLAASGFEVGAVTPPDHGIRKLKAAAYCAGNRYSGMVTTIAAAIESWSPDILIPCDDLALRYLHRLHALASERPSRHGEKILELIQTSLGDPANFDVTRRKSAFIAFAAAEGIAVPESSVIRDETDLRERLSAATFPIVLKTDGSWGGLGVRILRFSGEANRAFAELAELSGWRNTTKRAIKKLSVEPLGRRVKAPISTISLQRYIEGWPACRTVACRDGEVLAGLNLRALQTSSETGPSTVIRPIDNREMTEIAAHIVRRLRLSGLIGFDFIVETATGRPFLIELNARATPTCHLSLSDDTDLAGALAASVSGKPRRRLGAKAWPSTIALFPQELWRDPNSEYLRLSHHDVPWDNPKFIAAYALRVPADFPVWVGKLQRFVRSAKPFYRWPKGLAVGIGGALTRALASSGIDRGPL